MTFIRSLKRALAPKPAKPAPIIVVSGLPRSGTSLMMRMLEAGGLQVVADHERKADSDNPNGYYELEAVKRMARGDVGWLGQAAGQVVKVVSPLLQHLPEGHEYRIVFVNRALDEVLASQKKMLANRGEPQHVEDAELIANYRRHLAQVHGWLATRRGVQVLEVDYRELVQQPAEQVARIAAFVGAPLDSSAMVAAVDPKLYRHRMS